MKLVQKIQSKICMIKRTTSSILGTLSRNIVKKIWNVTYLFTAIIQIKPITLKNSGLSTVKIKLKDLNLSLPVRNAYLGERQQSYLDQSISILRLNAQTITFMLLELEYLVGDLGSLWWSLTVLLWEFSLFSSLV